MILQDQLHAQACNTGRHQKFRKTQQRIATFRVLFEQACLLENAYGNLNCVSTYSLNGDVLTSR